ncbi:hypothetical protein BU25DRAFT_424548 [Macroventuria anomochaeta]|uniref:Uncharacterized protein n=1 Tax=Macroventuria anomochaeta TaxID=301207 RepID=A0ACB6RPW5_9PLEO|nr:uncharacterized protein BU25DRAFT_424548 [Macroventuria anomochaeta]KAF2623868.1 hypothetical protein BU25DRAFT_424548 [Macroventuria anomochaeta]
MPRRYPTLRTFRSAYISTECGTLSEGDECCICLDPYDNSSHQAVGVTSNSECGHVFGRQCLEAYLDSTNPGKNTCPVCRRKWYTRRSINLSTPRDTNTSQVLAPPTQLRTPTRDGVESRALQRLTSREHVQATSNISIGRHVEQLVNNMEFIEALEATGAPPLDQEVRVRLRQLQGRIRAFLDRNDETVEASVGSIAPRSRPHAVLQGTAERTSRHLPDLVIAELDNGQDPYSLLGVAFQNSTLSLPDLSAPRMQASQQSNFSPAVAPPMRNSRRGPTALARTTTISRSGRAMPRLRIPTPTARTEAHQPQTGRVRLQSLNGSRSQPTIQGINTQMMEGHLQAYWSENPDSSNMRQSESLPNRRSALPDIAELEGTSPPLSFAGTAANQAISRDVDRRSVHTTNHEIERAQLLLPRYPTSRLRRSNSTLGLPNDSQPVGTPPQPILAASMAQRPAGLRSRITAPDSPHGFSRMMSISNLLDLVSRNRAR